MVGAGASELGGQGGHLPTHILVKTVLNFIFCPPTFDQIPLIFIPCPPTIHKLLTPLLLSATPKLRSAKGVPLILLRLSGNRSGTQYFADL